MKFRREDLEISNGRKLYLYNFDESEEAHKRQEKFWSQVAENWRTRSEVIERWFDPVTDRMMEQLGVGPGRLLDVGCGAQTMPIPSGWETVGLDISGQMLRKGARAVVGGCYPLPFLAGSFDAVISRFALMFADAEGAMEEIIRVLKPDGVLVFCVWGPEERNLWSSIPSEVTSKRLGIRRPGPDEPHAFRLADRDNTRRMLEEVGFAVEQFTEVKVRYLEELNKEVALTHVLSFAGPLHSALERASEKERRVMETEILMLYEDANLTGLAHVWAARKPA